MLAGGLDNGHVGIMVSHSSAAGAKQFHQGIGGGFAVIVHVGLVGQTEQEDGAALDWLLVVVERFSYTVRDIGGHGGVDR